MLVGDFGDALGDALGGSLDEAQLQRLSDLLPLPEEALDKEFFVLVAAFAERFFCYGEFSFFFSFFFVIIFPVFCLLMFVCALRFFSFFLILLFFLFFSCFVFSLPPFFFGWLVAILRFCGIV